jgi:hypothetical protein
VEQFSSLHQFKDKEVKFVTLAETDKLDDVGVICSSHDLNLLQDVGTLQHSGGDSQLIVPLLDDNQRADRDGDHVDSGSVGRGKQTNLRNPSLLLEVGIQMLVAALSSRVASKPIGNKEERWVIGVG